MTSLSISVPLSVVAETTIASVAVAETVSTIASVGESVATIAKAKTIGQGIPVASVVGISLSGGSGLGLGLPLAVVSSGPVSTLVTSAMAVVVIVARLSEGDTGEEDGGDNEEFHDETSYQQQLQI